MKTKIEFHCHTSNSFDCKVSLEKRLKCYNELGFTHLAITDHDNVMSDDNLSIVSAYTGKLQVIPSIEVSTFVGHIILLNCKRKPWINSLLFLFLWSKIYHADIYVPHPCRKGT